MASNRKRKRNAVRQLVIVALVIIALIFGFKTYSSFADRSTKAEIHFVNPDTSLSPTFYVDLAISPEEQSRGLMYRQPADMGKKEGMLFIYANEQEHSFWMKNTYIPLDMIFIGANRSVVGVLENVPILNTNQRTVGKPSLYVLELHAGTASKAGIVEGSVLKTTKTLPKGGS